MTRRLLAYLAALGLALLAIPAPALAQQTDGFVLANCGTIATPYLAGNFGPLTIDVNGNLCAGNATAQGSTTAGQVGPLVQGAVTTGAPTYVTGQTSPLSLTVSGGGLRVQPISNTGASIASNTGGASSGLRVAVANDVNVGVSPYPWSTTAGTTATPITAASGNVANASAAATLAGAASKTTYITGFVITAAGATAGACVNATITGTISTTLTFTYCVPTGAAVGASPLVVTLDTPIPASAANTAIVLTLPALGAGNTNASVNAFGYQL